MVYTPYPPLQYRQFIPLPCYVLNLCSFISDLIWSSPVALVLRVNARATGFSDRSTTSSSVTWLGCWFAVGSRVSLRGLVSDESDDHAVEVEEEHQQVETQLEEGFLSHD